MWRSLSTLFVLFFLTTFASAVTYIYYPTSGVVSDGGVFYIGKVGKGHLVKLILNAEDPSPINSISADIPVEVNYSVGRVFVTFYAPREEGNHSVTLIIERNMGTETIHIAFDVVSKPLSIKLPSSSVGVPEAGKGTVDIGIINTGVGLTRVKVYSTFPSDEKTVTVFPHEASKVTLTLMGSLSGKYEREVVVLDLLSGEEYRFPLTVSVYPTLEGRIKTVYLLADPFLPILYPIRLLLGVIFWRM